ncbi:hypothetical protein BOTBODRAFT_161080 [Botryobasidium botryosum FD-172 SS1]|uniref:Copper homeostasis protein cutC homolog n=1 Tax=Botryobasidium botryosum (strain FD-172 SS1) TaxID=930990 RepID=A0A067MDW5_BOTB1|nr:hypothetical protein BOTBODRAFT_161080 [Botryobasidium botryosum FD-172 SS1]
MSILIEVCVDSLESAILAVRGGAKRLEICGCLGLGGGTTPSLGLVRSIRKALPDIPTMVMIRPRTGDFLYSEDEMSVMVEDIKCFKTEGVTGVVLGVLTSKGDVDVERTSRLVKLAVPLEVTFHRAFDMTRDAQEALRAIASISGITRILTCGHGPTALSAQERESPVAQAEFSQKRPHYPLALRCLKKKALALESSIIILPGSGIKHSTVATLIKTVWPVGVREIHMSGGEWVEGDMEWRPEGMGMGVGGRGEWGVWKTSQESVTWAREAAEAAISSIGSLS